MMWMRKRAIIQAEQFKANVAPPKGNDIIACPVQDNDDDFFHITCHVEPSLKEKIKKGGIRRSGETVTQR